MSRPKPGIGRGIYKTFENTKGKGKASTQHQVHALVCPVTSPTTSNSHHNHNHNHSPSITAIVNAHSHVHGHGHGHGHGQQHASSSRSISLVPVVHHVGRSNSNWSPASGSTSVSASSSGFSSVSSSGSGSGSSSNGKNNNPVSPTPPSIFDNLSNSSAIPDSNPTSSSYFSTPLIPIWDSFSSPLSESSISNSSNYYTTYSYPTGAKDIIEPYRPARQPPPVRFRSNPLSLPLIDITQQHKHLRPYSTVSAPRYEAMDSGLHTFSFNYTPPIPPSLLHPIGGKYHGGLPLELDHLNLTDLPSPPPPPPPLSSEMGLMEIPARTGPSPGPGPVKPPRSVEPHPVLSPSPPSSTNLSSQYSAAVTAQTLSFPHTPTTDIQPNSPERGVSTSLYSSSLQFKIGASGLAKQRAPPTPPRDPSRLRPLAPPRKRAFQLPEVNSPTTFRSIKVGEDAYFTRLDAMCVADGVGGWAKSGRDGADAARWSLMLTHFCEEEVGRWWDGTAEYIEKYEKSPKSKIGTSWISKKMEPEMDDNGLESGWRRKQLDPIEIMQRGFEKCLSCAISEGITGSSTCLLALLHHSTLHLANLGDCALLVIRDGEVIFRTTEMTHAFNHPMQLGPHSRDEPMKDAKQWQVDVKKEDVVVMGSDGLMDNMFDEDILDILATFASPSSTSSSSSTSHLPTPPSSRPSSPAKPTSNLPRFDPQKVSEALCAKARSISEQTTSTTPFMHRCIEEGIDFVGGKKDDITVIVGVVGEKESRDGKGVMELRT